MSEFNLKWVWRHINIFQPATIGDCRYSWVGVSQHVQLVLLPMNYIAHIFSECNYGGARFLVLNKMQLASQRT